MKERVLEDSEEHLDQAGPWKEPGTLRRITKRLEASILNHRPPHFAIFMFTPKSSFIHGCQNSCSHSGDEALGFCPS